ncbi:hypothetical protein AB0L74_10245 [Streptomyces sp. NPDC052020]|uniref:hypothetical protein n=1 Tax=Streptomyces sp. NPDC052020 TaxID=3155677 RepID=UPI003412D285
MRHKRKAIIYFETKEALLSLSELEALSQLKEAVQEYGLTLVGALVEPAGETYSVEYLRILRMWRNDDVQVILTWDDEMKSRAFYDTEFPGFPDLRDVDAVLEEPDPDVDAEDLAYYVERHQEVIRAALQAHASGVARDAKEELEDLLGIEDPLRHLPPGTMYLDTTNPEAQLRIKE